MAKKQPPRSVARPLNEEDISTPQEVPRERQELEDFFESLGPAGVTELTL